MARSYALSDLIARCQSRADMAGGAPYTPSEWRAMFHAMYGEAYQIVEASGMRHFESTQTFTITGATTYALPTDHLATISIDYYDTSGRARQLEELMVQERDCYIGLTGDAFYFEIAGQYVSLCPTPSSGTYKHLYMPQPPDLTAAADATQVDTVNADGEEFIILGTAVKAMGPKEYDVSYAVSEREAARKRFIEWCAMRSFNNPRHRVNVDSDAYDPRTMDPASWRWRL